jgi:hypothetical protein
MTGSLDFLPLLDLQQSRTGQNSDRQALAGGKSGTVIHEMGHFLAAAKFGIPVDFVVLNWAPDLDMRTLKLQKMHFVHCDDRYYDMLNATPDQMLGVLAGGIFAEGLVFGTSVVDRSRNDLEIAAKMLGFDTFDVERDSTRLVSQLKTCCPLVPSDAALLVDMHNVLAEFINAEGGPDDIFVIPYYRMPRRFRRLVPFWRRIRAIQASKSVRYGIYVRNLLLPRDIRRG